MEAQKDFQLDQVFISSKMDSGNLAKVQRQGSTFKLWTGRDPKSLGNSCWFYFKVIAPAESYFTFTIMNYANAFSLYNFGMRPVVRTPRFDWTRIQSTRYLKGNNGMQLTIDHWFQQQYAQFAFTYPWTYTQTCYFLNSLHPPGNVFIHKQILTKSLQNRDCEILILSSSQGQIGYTSYGWPSFPSKRIVVISSRVHPGQTAASYVMKGLIQFLISEDPRAIFLREAFVFYLIPLLNPDGVANGYFRYDTLGNNLNRCYSSPDPSKYPTVYALKQLLRTFSRQIYSFIDLHAHPSVKGIFIFGNYSSNFATQVQICMIPSLMAVNSKHFHWDNCNFSSLRMDNRDNRGESLEGSARVSIFQQTGILRTYTMECNFHSGTYQNSNFPNRLQGSVPYTREIFEENGKALLVSLLDSIDANPFSELNNLQISDLHQLRVYTACKLAERKSYAGQEEIRKAARSFRDMEAYLVSKWTNSFVGESEELMMIQDQIDSNKQEKKVEQLNLQEGGYKNRNLKRNGWNCKKKKQLIRKKKV